jgi:predicted metal-dependent phosphoesterase TrpH
MSPDAAAGCGWMSLDAAAGRQAATASYHEVSRRRTLRIDLHAHSTASDGTLDPSDLVHAAAQAGLDVLALTDHDTTAGWERARAALPPGLTLVPGCELSCRMPTAQGPISLHLLAYLFDPDEPRLAAARRRLRDARDARAAQIIDKLQADGHPVTRDLVDRLAGGGPIGRPHIAAALVELRLVRDLDEAFTPAWVGPGGRYRVPRYELDAAEAIQLVAAAGGVSVFAHPYAARRGAIVGTDDIETLARAGLTGVEAEHPDHFPEEAAELRRLGHDLGLVVTGASDFHGAGRPQGLGAALTDPDAYERLVNAASGHPFVRSGTAG